MSDADTLPATAAGTSSQGTSKANIGNAIWTWEEELTLVQFLAGRQAEAGDGMAFQKKTWMQASEEMKQFLTAGALKTWVVCKNKWGRVCWHLDLSVLDLV